MNTIDFDLNKTSPAVEPEDVEDPSGSGKMSTGLTIGLAIVLVGMCVSIALFIFFIVSRRKGKKSKQRKDEENVDKAQDKDGGQEKGDKDYEEDEPKAHSLKSDLPSTAVQSIVIDNKELRPVKSGVFAWKSKHRRSKKKKSKNKDKKGEQKNRPKDKEKGKPNNLKKVKQGKKDNKKDDKKDKMKKKIDENKKNKQKNAENVKK